ncbi:MAG: hypothetical protein EA382_02230 [Spirochaetaceae bacterium]|nr:MAG: hypothetical protein EA382_02230 [Spirochaetaceae bacterium]
MHVRSATVVPIPILWAALAIVALTVGCDGPAAPPLRVTVYVPGQSRSAEALVDGIRDAIAQSRPVELTVEVAGELESTGLETGRSGRAVADARIGVGATIALTLSADASRTTFFTAVVDPVGSGLLPSLAEEVGAVIGVASLPPIRGLFELVAQISTVRVVGYLYDRRSPDATAIARLASMAAPAAGIELVAIPFDLVSLDQDATDHAAAGPLGELLARVDALLVDGPLYGGVWIDSVLDLLAESTVATITVDPVWGAAHGALIAYGTDPAAIGRATGTVIADSMRRDRGPYSRLQFPTGADDLVLLVNTASAERTGVEIPSALTDAADTVLGHEPGAADD